MKWIQNLPILLAALVVAGGVTFVAINVLASGVLPDGPAEVVWDREVCAHCRMHVGEPAFATQLQTSDGRILSFDDPGCAALYLRENEIAVHALYFRHHAADRWIPADDAAFVTVSPTPMGFGYGAVDGGAEDAIPWSEAADRMARRNGP
jgi:copper chaperone NosL